MSPATGPLLRLAGPLIQVACLLALVRLRAGPPRTWAGQSLESLLYAGFALGLLLVVAGLALSGPRSRPRPPGERL